MVQRRVAIVVPARNEAARIIDCLQHLTALATDRRVVSLEIVLLANNCTDATVEIARDFPARASAPVIVEAVTLAPADAHAGWARRLAFDAGAGRLAHAHDLLLCTDADTRVARDWLTRTLDHLDAGYDAVAGFARLDPKELRLLDPAHRARLAAIRRYDDACCYLKATRTADEPWPRHFYEGGASIALTLGAYRATGGAPTPHVGEDKALFDALRAAGRRIRHPKDVRVLTSCRTDGRAPEGAADTLARWGAQELHEGLQGLDPVMTALGSPVANDHALTFMSLPSETALARSMVRTLRLAGAMAQAS